MRDRYAVVGNPIGHSKSPLIHETFARGTGQDIRYVALEAPLGGFVAAVDAFREGGAGGINITAPFKLDAFAYATEHLDRARLSGATNVLKFEGDRVIADNFDGVGLVRDIVDNLGVPLRGRRVLMLGAGGAARGAALPILEQEPAEFAVVNRTVAKAEALRDIFAPFGGIVALGYDALGGTRSRYDVVINATSASLRGELPPVRTEVFAPDALAYELAYGKGLTPFLRLARGAGVGRVADGVGMLVEQAAEAFAWWRGVRPATQPVIAQLTIPLA